MNKNQKMMVAAGAIVLVCAAFACILAIGGYIYREELQALLGLAPTQNIAKMLPEDTQFYMSTNPNVQSLPGYQNLKELYLDNPDILALWDEFEAEVTEEANITYEDDIKPWLGSEVTLAVPDLMSSINNPSETPPIVIAVRTTNKEASDNFISKILAQATEDGDAFSEETYSEVTLHIQQDQPENEGVIMTTFDDFVIASNNNALVKEMIDKAQGNSEAPSLTENAKYQKIVNELPPQAIATMYIEIYGIFETAIKESGVELLPEQTKDLEAFEAVGVAGTLQPNGIQFDVVVTYNVEKMSERMKASLQQPGSPNAVLNDIPADALFVYNGNNLNNIWQQTRASLESNPDFGEGIKDLEQELGLSIDENIFGWMTGEFALVLLEIAPPDQSSPPLGGYVLIGTDNVDNARSHVEKALGVLEEQGGLPPFETKTIGGAEMNLMADPFSQQVMGGYGFYNNYFLAGYLEDSLVAATSAANSPLSGSSNFKTVQDRLPGNNYGYMYANLERGRLLIEDQLSDFEREDYEKNVRPFFEPVRAVGMSASSGGVENGLTKGVFFLLLSK